MKKIVINGGRPLKGEVTISGAKNSVVALIPATILSDEIVTLDCVPDISDVVSLIDIMEAMGATVERQDDTLRIDPRGIKMCQCLMVKSIACVLLITFMVACWAAMAKQQLVCLVAVIWVHDLLTCI